MKSKLKVFIEEYQGKLSSLNNTIVDLKHKNEVMSKVLQENGLRVDESDISICESEVAENAGESRARVPTFKTMCCWNIKSND